MQRIILYGHSGSGNHGCEAIIRSTFKILGQKCRVFSNHCEQDIKYGIDKELLSKFSINIPIKSLRRYFFAVYSRIFKKSMLRYKYLYKPFTISLSSQNIYLSVGGDHYCYGAYSNHIYGFLNKKINDKGAKSILWSCSINTEDLDDESIKDLKSYSLITARESITYNNLIKLGIKENVRLYPDVAFQLDLIKLPLPKGFEEGNTIGINISPMIERYASDNDIVLKNYIALMDYIIKNTNCNIALIPHVVWEDNNDLIPLSKLYSKFKDTGRVVLIKDHNAMELKGFISRCRIFVGARTHATIAAYSTCVPTLVVGYSVKARGIAKDIFGEYEHYTISAQSLKEKKDLTESFKWILEREEEIRKHLVDFMPEYINKTKYLVNEIKGLSKE
mgnify:FL=1